MQAPVLTTIRQRVVPRRWSQSLKELWRAQVEPPRLPPDLTARLREVFDADLAQLGSWLGIAARLRELPRGRPRAEPHVWASGLTRASSNGQPSAVGAEPAQQKDRDDLGTDQLLAGLETLCAAGRRPSC